MRSARHQCTWQPRTDTSREYTHSHNNNNNNNININNNNNNNNNIIHLTHSLIPCLPACRVVRELMRYQIDTMQDEDEDSNSPLHLACINGHVGVAKVLIAANCDVEARLGGVNTCYCIVYNPSACVHTCVCLGCSIYGITLQINSLFPHPLSLSPLSPGYYYRNSTLWTPMDCAASGGYDELVILLIKAEADVDPTDKSKVHVGADSKSLDYQAKMTIMRY